MSESDLTVHEERYPTARVPGAQSLADVLAGWAKEGRTPVELAPEQCRRTIRIVQNVLDGKVETTWDSHGFTGPDGAHLLGLMADALYSMYEYFVGSPGRPKLCEGTARAAILLDGNRLQFLFDPANDPVLVKGILVAALWKLIGETHEDNPLTGLLEWEQGK